MQVFSIPVEGRFILYRPLLQLAFVGNQAMADLVLRLANQADDSSASLSVGVPEAALSFLQTIGFLSPDPPAPPNLAYHTTMAVLLLTNRCDLRCTYCYANGGAEPAQDLPLELARVAIDTVCRNALELGQPRFELCFHGGGEPVQAWTTLREATAYARSKSIPCDISLVTNGVWTARQREWILQNLNGVSISFDGGQATQDRQRPFVSGQSSFKAVMHTITALDQAGFPYGIRMTATTPWREQLPQDVRFICQETGCRAMQVEPAFNTRRGEHQGPTDAEAQAFAQAFMEAFEIARQVGRQLTYSGARPWLLTRAFCTAPYGALIVNAAGDWVACYEVASSRHPLAKMSTVGHILGDQVVIDTPSRDALIAYLEAKRDRCQDCFCYWHCAGDCYTRSFFAQAAPSRAGERSPRCTMNREIAAHILLWYIMAGDGVWRGQGAAPQEARLLRSF